MPTILSDTPDISDILAHPVALANEMMYTVDVAGIEDVEGYEGIKRRFMDGFEAFVNSKKHAAVCEVLRNELGDSALANSDNVIEAVMKRVDDEALIEAPYVFIAVNPKMMI